MKDVAVGDRVRDKATGRVGLVREISFDNSCSDPDCCGGPYPDAAYVYFSAEPDDWDSYNDDCEGEFAGLEPAP